MVPGQTMEEQEVFSLWKAKEENGSCEEKKKKSDVLLN